MRTRMSGGVRGGAGDPSLLLDLRRLSSEPTMHAKTHALRRLAL
jgi:hypothetical protein